MNAFTIKDLENLSGIKAHTIRIWEQRYGLLKPQRTNTNIRYYCNAELKNILTISLLNKYGFKISQIGQMQPGERQEKVLELGEENAKTDRTLNELIQQMVDLNMDQFEDTIDHYIQAHGMETGVNRLILPFIEKMGILWKNGHLHPAHEILVSNSIRQKLVVAIESTPQPDRLGPTHLLFLPEGEYNELPLLLKNFQLRTHRTPTIYLGANVPMKDVEFVVQLKKPDFAYIPLTRPSDSFNLSKFLIDIQHLMRGKTTLISGSLVQQYRKKPPPGILFETVSKPVTT